MILKLRNYRFSKKNFPLVVGILNLTPDSFSDGGLYNNEKKAMTKVARYIDEGVDIIDIGAESSRPNSKRISFAEEKKRLFPILSKIRKEFNIPISLDTVKSQIAEIGLKEGVDIINDISGLSYDERMASIIGENKGAIIINHTSGMPEVMQSKTAYKNIFKEIKNFFNSKIRLCFENNISKNSIVLDPGIGFGKLTNQNIKLVKNISKFHDIGFPIMYGVSNKKFLGDILKIEDPQLRSNASVITALFLTMQNVSMLRVHNVKDTVEMIKLWRTFK
tara:strand:- start:56726 stop:57556 length:831 start_codon:yes stop_codon:yes gene_type:complete